MAAHKLYLIRHGVAEERGDEWPDDTRRPLSEDGMAGLRKEAKGFVRLGMTFDVVLTSPLVRARQTADIVAAVFNARPPIITIDSLSPGGSTQSVLNDLEAHSRRAQIAIVGHEPGLGELAARLAGLKRALQFKKGAVCRIDVESLPPAGPGALRWFLTPKILRELRK